MNKELVSKVWRIYNLVGRVDAGLLVFRDGRISYVTGDEMIFDKPVKELSSISWPLLRMGLGFDTVVDGEKYKFSFAKPNPTAPELEDGEIDQWLRLIDEVRVWEAVKSLRNLKADKETTRMWKEILKKN